MLLHVWLAIHYQGLSNIPNPPSLRQAYLGHPTLSQTKQKRKNTHIKKLRNTLNFLAEIKFFSYVVKEVVHKNRSWQCFQVVGTFEYFSSISSCLLFKSSKGEHEQILEIKGFILIWTNHSNHQACHSFSRHHRDCPESKQWWMLVTRLRDFWQKFPKAAFFLQGWERYWSYKYKAPTNNWHRQYFCRIVTFFQKMI